MTRAMGAAGPEVPAYTGHRGLAAGRHRCSSKLDEVFAGRRRFDLGVPRVLRWRHYAHTRRRQAARSRADRWSACAWASRSGGRLVYLAALSLRVGGSGATEVMTFRGDDRFVADYLRLELLSRLTAADVRFLTRTSVLDRMCGGLCDAVLGRNDSASLLESLERSNRFLVPLGRTRTWYRYHHLFRDLLRGELQHREPEIAPVLNSRAMDGCHANALREPALQYAHEAGNLDAATRLIEQLALPTYFGISPSHRSASACSSHATPSRATRWRSTASSASRPEPRRSSAPWNSACWRTPCTRPEPRPHCRADRRRSRPRRRP
jgi:hypothetical protein